jgi:hypothetical protein
MLPQIQQGAGAGLGELDEQFVEQPVDVVNDVLGTVIGVKAQEAEWEIGEQGFQCRDQVGLADFRR